MDSGEMVKAARGKCSLPPSTKVSGVSIDSRSLAPDEAFIALRGLNRDGHAFVEAALSQGASCAIVEQDFKAPRGEKRLLRVADTLQALNDLGTASRARAKDTVVIAVTGSVGKTGTKEALKIALMPSGLVHVSLKSHNNHWGVPLSLANMRQDTNFGVFEAGMNHAGELKALTQLIRPHIAIITTVAPVHLGFFRSVEAIADAKAEILEGLVPGGAAILNRDNPYFERLRRHAWQRKAKVVSFGETQGADARSLSVELGPESSEVKADILGETVSYRIGAPGIHFVQNSLAVLAAAKLADADLKAAAKALARVARPDGPRRTHRHRRQGRARRHHRRKLQRQSRLDARGACHFGAHAAGGIQAPGRRARRHARAWRPRSQAASGAGGRHRRG